MRSVVRDRFVAFTAAFEGVLPYLYLDNIGLVTTAIGNLVDPIELVLGLPFYRPDGSRATAKEIAAAWRAVKARTDLAKLGGAAFARVTALRLQPDGIDRLVASRLDLNDAHLTRRFGSAYASAPADAQMALLSMAWAAGPNFKYPKLAAAVEAWDFGTAAAECELRAAVVNRSLADRNRANRVMFQNAAIVRARGLDSDKLHWPAALTPSELPTEPELPTTRDSDPPETTFIAVTDLKEAVEAGILDYRKKRDG